MLLIPWQCIMYLIKQVPSWTSLHPGQQGCPSLSLSPRFYSLRISSHLPFLHFPFSVFPYQLPDNKSIQNIKESKIIFATKIRRSIIETNICIWKINLIPHPLHAKVQNSFAHLTQQHSLNFAGLSSLLTLQSTLCIWNKTWIFGFPSMSANNFNISVSSVNHSDQSWYSKS